MAWRRPTGRSGVLYPVGVREAGSGGPRSTAQPRAGSGGTSAGAVGPSAGAVGPRRPGWPRGRALFGALLIAAAAVVVFAGALASTRGRSAGYVVASRPLAAGTVMGPGDTAVQTFSLPDGSRALAFRDGPALIGRTLAVPVAAGELIEAGMLAPAGSRTGSRPVSVEVDTTSLAGLQAGDPVDVLGVASTPAGSATGSGVGAGAGAGGASGGTSAAGGSAAGGSGGASAAAGGVTVIVRNAALLSLSRGGSALAPASTSTVVTLGVADLAEAEMLVQAEHSGAVELVRAVPADGTGPGPAPSG